MTNVGIGRCPLKFMLEMLSRSKSSKQQALFVADLSGFQIRSNPPKSAQIRYLLFPKNETFPKIIQYSEYFKFFMTFHIFQGKSSKIMLLDSWLENYIKIVTS
jgi:hypothetical protein